MKSRLCRRCSLRLDNHAQRKTPPRLETAEIIAKATVAKIPMTGRREKGKHRTSHQSDTV